MLILLALLFALPASAQVEISTSPEPVATGSAASTPVGLESFRGKVLLRSDDHVHPASSWGYQFLFDLADTTEGVHSHTWCDDAYDTARARGVEVGVMTHHSDHLENLNGFLSWVGQGVGPTTDIFGQDHPTDPNGWPLLVSGGYAVSSSDEPQVLFECAGANNEPGVFLAFYGIEYTPLNPTHASCTTQGEVLCGGHKTALYLTEPLTRCGDGDADCEDEGEFYDHVAADGGVWAAAHPNTSVPAEMGEYNASTARGGFKYTMVAGYEFSPGNETDGCTDADSPTDGAATSDCGFRQSLAWGAKVVPWHGSDNHLCPDNETTSNCIGSELQDWLVTDTKRTVTVADMFTRASFIAAREDGRVFWTANGKDYQPRLDYELESVQMGSTVTRVGDLDYALYVDSDGLDVSGGWEIGCGDVTADGTDGGYAVEASGSCTGNTCEASSTIATAGLDWCYLRAEDVGGNVVLASAPVFIE